VVRFLASHPDGEPQENSVAMPLILGCHLTPNSMPFARMTGLI
jgi:hypothetical protein